ncbi:MAG: uroporphyrinogen-III synthase [Bacteroidia bacterium]|nr:uroporphyrinogen-III synthase [Bacteroidia bacterium]
MKIKSILVSQPKPEDVKSPYFELAEKYCLKVDFRPFIHVEPIPARDFRKERINILDHTAVIFTSRTSVDHFYRICTEMRIEVPDEMKYFCISESIAFYLQKYIVFRKRKVFYGKGKFDSVIDLIEKYREDKFLVPLSDIHKQEIPEKLQKHKFKFTPAILYRTVVSDLSDLQDVYYDILVFFSPAEINSLFHNFPDFQQNSTKIAAFGPITTHAVAEAGLRLDIPAPTPQSPSMTMALEEFIKKFNKDNNKSKS